MNREAKAMVYVLAFAFLWAAADYSIAAYKKHRSETIESAMARTNGKMLCIITDYADGHTEQSCTDRNNIRVFSGMDYVQSELTEIPNEPSK